MSSVLGEHLRKEEIDYSNLGLISSILNKYSYDDIKDELRLSPFGQMKPQEGFFEKRMSVYDKALGIPHNIHNDIKTLNAQVDITSIDLNFKIKDFEKDLEVLKTAFGDIDICHTEPMTIQKALPPDSIDIISFDDIEASILPFKDLDYESLLSAVELQPLRGIELSPEAFYRQLLRKWEAVEDAKRLLRVLSRKVDFLIGQLNKTLRNLRHVFTKLHSFHFKNLDDYHSTNLNLRLQG